MIKREEKKVYYTKNVITDVTCDNCNKQLANDKDLIYRAELTRLYYVEDSQSLGGDDYPCYSVELCEECASPIEGLLRSIEAKIHSNNK